MTMIAGLVSVNAAGIASGTGLAKELFDDYLPEAGDIPVGPLGAQSKRQIAKLCNSVAKTVVQHITLNAVVTVPPGVSVTVAVPAGTGATTAPGVGTVA
jgi:hypothetical protein